MLSLADVIRCKETAGRAKDLMQPPILRLTRVPQLARVLGRGGAQNPC